MESFLPELSEGALGKSKVGGHILAELQYTSWWDGSGMKFEMDQVARIGVMGAGGLGDSGNARKKSFFTIDVFPYCALLRDFSGFHPS